MYPQQQNNTIFWIEITSIRPNPQQPRKEFNDGQLKELAESIKQYGILQPLLVTRHETEVPHGTTVEYELISGERRWRAAKIAGLNQIPVIIRKEPAERVKLELALIENLQREDLNPIEKAKAFKQLSEDFHMKHREISQKIGKSRVYVTNTMRLLFLPQEMTDAIAEGKMTESQGRSLLMLSEKPEAQKTLFNDIIYKGINAKESEILARRIAYERARKQEGLHFNEETRELENRLAVLLGTRVYIDRKGDAGKISISFSSEDQLKILYKILSEAKEKNIFQDEDLTALNETRDPARHFIEKENNFYPNTKDRSDENPIFNAPFSEQENLIIQEISSPAPFQNFSSDPLDNIAPLPPLEERPEQNQGEKIFNETEPVKNTPLEDLPKEANDGIKVSNDELQTSLEAQINKQSQNSDVSDKVNENIQNSQQEDLKQIEEELK